MTDLAAWLLTQIEADEMIALRARDNGGMIGGDNLAAWTPARVLAECAAKRELIRFAQQVQIGVVGPVTSARRGALDDALLILAQPYRDRDSWQEAWTL